MLLTYLARLITGLFLSDYTFFFSSLFSAIISAPLIHLLIYKLYEYYQTFFNNILDSLDFDQQPFSSPKNFLLKAWQFTYIMCPSIYHFLFALFLIGTFIASFIADLENETFKLSYRIIVFLSLFISLLLPFFHFYWIFALHSYQLIKQIKNSQTQNFNESQLSLVDIDSPPSNPIAEISDTESIDDYHKYCKDFVESFLDSIRLLICCNTNGANNINTTTISKFKAIVSIIIYFVLILTTILLDCVGKYRWNGSIMNSLFSIIYMILFAAFTFPCLIGICNNFSILKKAENRIIFIIWKIIVFVYIIFIALLLLYVYAIAKLPNQIEYIYHPTFPNVTYGDPAPICLINYHGLDLLQYAGIASLGSAKNITYANEMLKLLFSNSTVFSSSNDPMHIPILHPYPGNHSLRLEINSNLSVVSIHSITDFLDMAFVIENFLIDVAVRKIMGMIPLFDTIFSFVYIEIINLLTDILFPFYQTFIASTKFTETIYNLHTNLSYLNSTIVYTGYSAGGMLAKSLSILYDDSQSIAFNSLQSYYSTFLHLSKISIADKNKKNINFVDQFLQAFIHKKSNKIVNLYSPDSIKNQPEIGPSINYQSPNVKIKSPSEMLCLLSAGCDTSGKYEDFCASILGSEKKYGLFFDRWNRSRNINYANPIK